MYTEKDLVRIAKRRKNLIRNYLVVNPLQGKHIPVRPHLAFELFGELAALIQRECKNERLLLAGFAETATAIGAAAAALLDTWYIQTTREEVPGAEFLDFTESHSHASMQRLAADGLEQVLKQTDRLIFVEDEVTTGNTILHIIEILNQKYPRKIKYAVASLLNGMGEEALSVYRERGIPVYFLVKTSHSGYPAQADSFRCDGVSEASCGIYEYNVPQIKVKGWLNPRRCLCGREYLSACQKLWEELKAMECFRQSLPDKTGRVLVLGTEEFMYPALYLADQMEQEGFSVWFHATTRSPVEVSTEKIYPLHRRYQLKSLYDSGRETFIYDLETYDSVLIITEQGADSKEGLNTLIHALRLCKNDRISVIRWCQ